MKTLRITVLAVLASMGSGAARAVECGPSLTVHFPKVPLGPAERVVGVVLTVAGGSVVSVGGIPRDWGVSVQPQVSGVSEMSGNVQHGAAALGGTDQLPWVIVRRENCSPLAKPSFVLSALVHVTRDFAHTRTIELTEQMLQIQRTPNSTRSR